MDTKDEMIAKARKSAQKMLEFLISYEGARDERLTACMMAYVAYLVRVAPTKDFIKKSVAVVRRQALEAYELLDSEQQTENENE